LFKGAEATELPTASATDSDMETGSLVIDEGEKKKPLKRKVLSSTTNTPVSNAFVCYLFIENVYRKCFGVLIYALQYCTREQLLTNVLREKFRNCRQTFLKFK